MQGLRGRAWDAVEDLDIHDFEKDKGWELVLKRLDATYKYDARTEMPMEFENFFMKLGRKPRETLLEFTSRFHVPGWSSPTLTASSTSRADYSRVQNTL